MYDLFFTVYTINDPEGFGVLVFLVFLVFFLITGFNQENREVRTETLLPPHPPPHHVLLFFYHYYYYYFIFSAS